MRKPGIQKGAKINKRSVFIFIALLLFICICFFSASYFFNESILHSEFVLFNLLLSTIPYLIVSVIFWVMQPIAAWKKPFVIAATTLFGAVVGFLLVLSTFYLPGSRNKAYVEGVCSSVVLKHYGVKNITDLPPTHPAFDLGQTFYRWYAQQAECVENFYKGKGPVFSENPPGFLPVQTPQIAPTSSTQEYIDFNGKQVRVVRVGEGEYCEGRVGLNDYDIAKCNSGLKCQFRQGTAQDAPGTCVKE